MAKIVIIGAGLTGLSLAYSLEKNGFLDYEIYEAETTAGGLLKTVQENGFTFDYTGHFLHISNDEFRFFLDEVLGLENCHQVQRASYIYTHQRYINYPFQMSIGELPEDAAYECLAGFVARKKHVQNPKNFYQWVMKYFGKGFGKHFFFPYNQKQLNTPVRQIHHSWTSRFVPDTSLRSLTKSLLGGEKSENIGYNATFYYPKKGGIYSLVKKLCEKLHHQVHLGHKLVSIDPLGKKLIFANGTVAQYGYLVTTVPLPKTLTLLQSPTLNFTQALEKLTCNSVFNFNLGIAKDKISPHHWVYLPEKKFLAYRIGFWHNFAQHMVPEGCSAIYGEYSFLQNSKLQNQQTKDKQNYYFEKAVQQILNLLNIEPKDILLRKDLLLPYAYVVYDSWREKNLPNLLSLLTDLGIYSIGRFGEWKYSSMQEAFLDGQITCAELLRKLYQENQSVTVIKNLFSNA